MYIIAGNQIPEEAKFKLKVYGEIIYFQSNNIVYDAISSHPDIFVFQAEDKLILAPNSPKSFVKDLEKRNINFELGEKKLAKEYPDTAHYNIAFNDGLMIHKQSITDKKALDCVSASDFISVNQAYSRCTTLILKHDRIITSDIGVKKSVPNSFLVDDSSIILPGFEHGFFGGACGIFKDKLFILGEINTLPESDKIKKYIEKSGYKIVELNKGRLFDGGGLFFV